jgi:hypothetical protein
MTASNPGLPKWCGALAIAFKGRRRDKMPTSRVVHDNEPHIHVTEVTDMERKYDATYQFGNTTVHVIAPPPMSEEEKEKILADFHQAALKIWQRLSVEEQLKLNAEYKR